MIFQIIILLLALFALYLVIIDTIKSRKLRAEAEAELNEAKKALEKTGARCEAILKTGQPEQFGDVLTKESFIDWFKQIN